MWVWGSQGHAGDPHLLGVQPWQVEDCLWRNYGRFQGRGVEGSALGQGCPYGLSGFSEGPLPLKCWVGGLAGVREGEGMGSSKSQPGILPLWVWAVVLTLRTDCMGAPEGLGVGRLPSAGGQATLQQGRLRVDRRKDFSQAGILRKRPPSPAPSGLRALCSSSGLGPGVPGALLWSPVCRVTLFEVGQGPGPRAGSPPDPSHPRWCPSPLLPTAPSQPRREAAHPVLSQVRPAGAGHTRLGVLPKEGPLGPSPAPDGPYSQEDDMRPGTDKGPVRGVTSVCSPAPSKYTL